MSWNLLYRPGWLQKICLSLTCMCQFLTEVPIYFVLMCMCFACHVYMCTTCVKVPVESREGVVCHGTGVTFTVRPHVGTGDWTLNLWKSSRCFELLRHFPSCKGQCDGKDLCRPAWCPESDLKDPLGWRRKLTPPDNPPLFPSCLLWCIHTHPVYRHTYNMLKNVYCLFKDSRIVVLCCVQNSVFSRCL